ncbi:MAG: hypothetical protein LBO82_05905 [Synergistaceae bacterium]|nr:hypothetical protein [Synergistaceae bacterium]
MITQELKDYFCRHFLGRVKVSRLPVGMELPRVVSCKREAAVHPVRTRIEVTGSSLFVARDILCSSRGFRFSSQLARVRGAKIAKYALGELRTHTVPKLRAAVLENMRRVAVLPQERTNRLQWQPVRPKKDDEILLAWFGPIVEDAVMKLTLNKQQGVLLIWYNLQSRRFDAKGLYLYRRLGARENLEWRWL